MNLSDVSKAAGKLGRKRKRVGRGPGSGHGKTAGRGEKGAKSRSGYSRKTGYAGGSTPLFMRLPKRGFSNYPFRKRYQVVNVGDLERFDAGAAVGPEELCRARLVRSAGLPTKVLARGDITKAVTVRAHRFSKAAAEKISAAGGTAEVIE